jgi:hypothetical protein
MVSHLLRCGILLVIFSFVSCKTDDSKSGSENGGAGGSSEGGSGEKGGTSNSGGTGENGGNTDVGGSGGKGGNTDVGRSGGETSEPLTWTDSATKLTWTTNVEEVLSHEAASTYCADLELDGHKDWRLPTVNELRSIITGCGATETSGACEVTDNCLSSACRADSCGGCEAIPNDCYIKPALKSHCGYTWASATQSDYTDNAWGVGFNGAHVSTGLKTNSGSARCVR